MTATAPSSELAPIGCPRGGRHEPNPERPGHCRKCGRWTNDNDGHVTHGAYSRQRSHFVEPVRREIRTRLLQQKGFTDDDVPESLSIAIDSLVEAALMRESFFSFLVRSGGPISGKGRTRRAVDGWSRACDRCAKLANMIGLQREARDLDLSPAEWLTSQTTPTA